MGIKGGRAVDQQIGVKLFVRYGCEDRAVDFYRQALGAKLLLRHELADGTLLGADLRIGASFVTVVGANPRREVEPQPGCLRSPQALGTTPIILDLYVDDVDAAMNRAIAAGATLRNPIEDSPTGDRIGVFIDPFGHFWALATATEEGEPSEIPERQRQMAEIRR